MFELADRCRRLWFVTVLGTAVIGSAVGTCWAQAADWPHWRGPAYNGSSDATGLPTHWSAQGPFGWKATLPGPGAATPIIWGDRVFISSTDVKTDQLLALCFDRSTGKLRWRHEVDQGVRRDTRSTFAAPSPVTNGKQVVFFYGNGDLLAFDPNGRKLWQRNIQKDYGRFAFLWTFSSSPLLYQDTLYLQVLQRDEPVKGNGFSDRPNESYLLALRPEDGQELWRQVRRSDAVAESREAFSSPVPLQIQNQMQIVMAGGDDLTGHDPRNGRELWRWGTWNPTRIGHWRLVPSPVATGNVVLGCGPKRSPIYAVRVSQGGQLDDRHLAWTSSDAREVSTDVPTPAVWEGDFIVLSDVAKTLSRVDSQSGRVEWSVPTPGRRKYEASPTVANGKIYIVNFDGMVCVFSAEEGKLLHQVEMSEPSEFNVRSSIAVAGHCLFLRTNDTLYCIGDPPAQE